MQGDWPRRRCRCAPSFEQLARGGRLREAVGVLAQVLPKSEAIAWGLESIRQVRSGRGQAGIRAGDAGRRGMAGGAGRGAAPGRESGGRAGGHRDSGRMPRAGGIPERRQHGAGALRSRRSRQPHLCAQWSPARI